MKLTNERKAELFKALATRSVLDVGMEFGFDQHYSTKASIRGKVHQMYKEVLMDPAAFAVSEDTVRLVQEAVAARKNKNQFSQALVPLADKNKALEEMSLEDLVERNSKTGVILTAKRMAQLMKSPAELRKVPLASLATAMGILFDKGRLVKGEATEHVWMQAQVSENMTAAEKLELVLRMRELQNRKDGE